MVRTVGTFAWSRACRSRRRSMVRADAIATRETVFRLAPQPRPRVGAGSGPCEPGGGCAQGCEVHIERSRSRACETALCAPDTQQRDDEVSAAVAPHELDRVVTLTERDANTVSELAHPCHSASPIEADRADRRLDGHSAAFVESGKACHAASLPRSVSAGL